MLDRISTGKGIEDQIGSADRAQQAEKTGASARLSGPLTEFAAGVITDDPQISSEAKAKLAKEADVKPFVKALLAQGQAPLDTSRIDRFKQLVANGSIGDYLKDAIPGAVDGLLASPEGKALKASLR